MKFSLNLIYLSYQKSFVRSLTGIIVIHTQEQQQQQQQQQHQQQQRMTPSINLISNSLNLQRLGCRVFNNFR